MFPNRTKSKISGLLIFLACATLAIGADSPPGIWVDEAAPVDRVPSTLLSSARIEPLAVRHGLEDFVLTIGLIDPTNVDRLQVHIGTFTQNGIPVNPVLLFDNGLDGDVTAGDGLFTASNLALANAPSTVGSALIRFVNVDIVFNDTSVQSSTEDLALTALYVQPSVSIPQIEELAPDVAASPHVVSISMPLQGSFPDHFVSTTALTQRYYDFFPDDRDFLFIGRMFNTGGGAAGSFGTVRNDVQGIGISLFDSSSVYGSSGVLQGLMNIYWGNANWALMNHELLHRWAAHLDPSLNMSSVSSLNPGHWGAIEQDSTGFAGPPPYGGAFDHLEFVSGVEYRGWHDNDVIELQFSNLELYLMGLIDFSQLSSPIWTLVNPMWDRYETGAIRYSHYFADNLRPVTSAELIAAEGPRLPDATLSQKAFRSGTIVVYDRLLTPTELAFWEYSISEYEKPLSTFHDLTWQQAAGDLATLETYVPLVAGAVPDGSTVPGQPLRIGKTVIPNTITLIWDPSCRAADANYVVYQGPIGSFDAHTPVTCSTNGSTAWTFPAASDSAYYLVVPRNSRSEGAYGLDGDGTERAPNGFACAPQESGECQ